jgi:hypothetical protein
MNYDPKYFEEKKIRAKLIFDRQKTIYNPYFKTDIVLNSDGFHHLQFSARQERNKSEQLLKFSLLPLALEIIRKAGTIQEYRRILFPVGLKTRDGFTKMKNVEHWGLIAIVGENKIKIKTVLKRVGDGKIIFWSVMPYSRLKNQRLAENNIEEE